MPNSTFHFKQFSIDQDRCAMKVGTDGVLLGAWAGQHQSPKRILDVGTGTGLIALMMAQRFPECEITALEIDEKAAKQAEENVSQSPFAGQIDIIGTNFFNWDATNQFDLIVCNPPFYKHAHPAKTTERTLARHGIHFNIQDFMLTTQKIIAPGGKLACILPVSIFDNIEFKAHSWKINRICYVAPTPSKEPHRVMAEWAMTPPSELARNHLVIESGGRHKYSQAYIELTRHFYLKM